jgi:hypothetical protein
LPIPIDIPHLVCAVTGSTQPAKLAQLMNEADDGLLARFQWFWPEPVPFHIARKSPHALAAVGALDKLRELTMRKTETGSAPVMVTLSILFSVMLTMLTELTLWRRSDLL